DRYLNTSTRLFEVANRIASFAERSNLRLPSAGGIDEERVSAQPDVLVPPVPRGLADHDHGSEFGAQESVERPQQHGDKALRVVVHSHDHNTRGLDRGIRARPPRGSLSILSTHRDPPSYEDALLRSAEWSGSRRYQPR